MSYISIKFLIYLLRWIFSGVIMLMPLYLLLKIKCCEGKYQEYIHILLLQIVGAFIFWYIDNWIFKG